MDSFQSSVGPYTHAQWICKTVSVKEVDELGVDRTSLDATITYYFLIPCHNNNNMVLGEIIILCRLKVLYCEHI